VGGVAARANGCLRHAHFSDRREPGIPSGGQVKAWLQLAAWKQATHDGARTTVLDEESPQWVLL